MRAEPKPSDYPALQVPDNHVWRKGIGWRSPKSQRSQYRSGGKSVYETRSHRPVHGDLEPLRFQEQSQRELKARCRTHEVIGHRECLSSGAPCGASPCTAFSVNLPTGFLHIGTCITAASGGPALSAAPPSGRIKYRLGLIHFVRGRLAPFSRLRDLTSTEPNFVASVGPGIGRARD